MVCALVTGSNSVPSSHLAPYVNDIVIHTLSGHFSFYAISGGFGAYSKNPGEIGETIAGWLKNPDLLEKIKAAALKAARPRASYDIAREIAIMIFVKEENGIVKG